MIQRALERALPSFTGFTLLGSGGQGAVYEVYDPALGVRVALKVCWHDPNTEELTRTRDRFYREFDLLCRARTCENIVSVFRRDAAMSADGRQVLLWYTMERCQQAISARIEQLALASRVAASRQLMRAVSHLGAQGIAHRDIKLQNVFVVQEPPEGPLLIKLGDFGIARSTTTGDELARTLTGKGTVQGTGRYLPPEVMDTGGYDPLLGDQYTTALVIYELLSRGSLPFGDGPCNILGLLRLKATGVYHPLPIPDFDGHAEPVDRVLRRMTRPNPRERYRTVGEAERALQSALLSSDLVAS